MAKPGFFKALAAPLKSGQLGSLGARGLGAVSGDMSIEDIMIINTSPADSKSTPMWASRAEPQHMSRSPQLGAPATSAPILNAQLLSSWVQSSSFFSVCEFHESTASAESVSA